MLENLRKALASRKKIRLNLPGRVPSAVILLLYSKDGEYNILFTKRTETVRDHRGQISFPGGVCHKADNSRQETALRECLEEVGIAPDQIEILGELDDIPTFSSNYVISPFVGLVRYPFKLKVSPQEIQEIIEVPVSALMDGKNLRCRIEMLEGRPVRAYYYSYNGNVIWGATARILHQFLNIFEHTSDT